MRASFVDEEEMYALMRKGTISEMLESFSVGTEKKKMKVPPMPSEDELVKLRDYNRKSNYSHTKDKLGSLVGSTQSTKNTSPTSSLVQPKVLFTQRNIDIIGSFTSEQDNLINSYLVRPPDAKKYDMVLWYRNDCITRKICIHYLPMNGSLTK